MSDEWKIVQGLKNSNQRKSFTTDERMTNYLSIKEDILRQREEEKWLREWGRYSDEGLFEKEFEEGNIEAFKNFILGCRKKKIELSGIRGDVSFIIKREHPLEVSFDSGNRDSTVLIRDNELLYSQVEVGKEKWDVRYKYRTPTSFSRSVYVINERTSRY